jgi:hypothetical protein
MMIVPKTVEEVLRTPVLIPMSTTGLVRKKALRVSLNITPRKLQSRIVRIKKSNSLFAQEIDKSNQNYRHFLNVDTALVIAKDVLCNDRIQVLFIDE